MRPSLWFSLYIVRFSLLTVLAAPAWAQVHLGVQTGPDPGTPASGPWVGPFIDGGTVTINFDDMAQPCLFGETMALTDEYEAFGVVFSGPDDNDGGAVLDECSNFGVTGHTPPNFLAFNSDATFPDGGLARGPETMTFSPEVSMVSINAGSPFPGTITMECFDAADVSLGVDALDAETELAPLIVTAPDIASCVVSTTEVLMVLDDLVFTPNPVPVELEFFSVDRVGPSGS